MKALDEAQALEHMDRTFKRHGRLSGMLEGWTRAKVTALQAMEHHCRMVHGRGIDVVLDAGIGDMDVMRAWPRFQEGVEYHGVDGCDAILQAAEAEYGEEYGGVHFHRYTFGQLACMHEYPVQPDVVCLLDVLYHIPDADMADDLVQWAVDSNAEYIVLTHATDPSQVFDSAHRPGEAGYAWFPHPFRIPHGWDVVHQQDSEWGVQRQRVLVLARNSVE